MLKLQETTETSAAQVAVTPHELAEAIASVEAKREEVIHTNTVALGEAVSHLGLTITPDELLAAIMEKKALEAELAQRTRLARQKRLRKLTRLTLLVSLLANLVLVGKLVSAPVGGLQNQDGMFQSYSGQTGEVRFPKPYTRPPNVEFTDISPSFTRVQPFDITSAGFKWRNTGADDMFNNKEIHWTARGDQ